MRISLLVRIVIGIDLTGVNGQKGDCACLISFDESLLQVDC